MELTGEHRIAAPRQVVWEALHDPQILKDCIKGCSKLDMADDGTMTAKVTAKVGPVKATFDANVEIVNEVAPESYTLQGEGKGGVAGFAKGSADVQLAEDGTDTILTFQSNATVGGKLAQLGSRLVDSTAKRYASDFFSCLSQKVGAGAAEPEAEIAGREVEMPEAEIAGREGEAAVAAAMPTAAAAPTDTPIVPPASTTPTDTARIEAKASGGGSTWLWTALVVAAVIIAVVAYQYAG